MRIVAFGTYDEGKPRVRILLRGMEETGVDIIECHKEVWHKVEDKSQIHGIGDKLKLFIGWFAAYPKLLWCYLHTPPHDLVYVGYLGLVDVLVLWPLARIRRVPIVWDMFIPLYNMVVEDRRLIRYGNPIAWLLYFLEYLAVHAADLVLIDTEAHARYICDKYKCSNDTVRSVFVGAEPNLFDPEAVGMNESRCHEARFRVIFYGQFIPLHGIETVVRAAKICENSGIEWLIIGRGQETGPIKDLVDKLVPVNLRWIEWVDYKDLVRYLLESHVALGIFGKTDKAARVIPNKIFQILMAGRPLVTGDTPAIRELLTPSDSIKLVPVGEERALAKAVLELKDNYPKMPSMGFHAELKKRITPLAIGKEVRQLLNYVVKGKRAIQ